MAVTAVRSQRLHQERSHPISGLDEASRSGWDQPELAATIMVVDDDREICAVLHRYLTDRGFCVLTALNATQMRGHLARGPIDLVLLDLVLPGVDGLALAQELRTGSNPGIIMVTGRGDEVDRIVGLEVGADDYVAKPFRLRELLARIRSVLRRLSEAQKPADSRLTFSGWHFDLRSRQLRRLEDDRLVALTAQEHKVLERLARSAGREVTRADLFAALSSQAWQPNDRTVDGVISHLRKKLDTAPGQSTLIKSVRGVGYMLAQLPNLFGYNCRFRPEFEISG